MQDASVSRVDLSHRERRKRRHNARGCLLPNLALDLQNVLGEKGGFSKA